MKVMAFRIAPVIGIVLGALLAASAVRADDNAVPAADAAYASDAASPSPPGEASEPSGNGPEQVLEIPQTYTAPEPAQPQSTQTENTSPTDSTSADNSQATANPADGSNNVAPVPDEATGQALSYGSADDYQNQTLMNSMVIGAPLVAPGPFYGPYYGAPTYYVVAPPRVVHLTPQQPVRIPPVSSLPPPRVGAGTHFGGFAHPGHFGGTGGGGFGGMHGGGGFGGMHGGGGGGHR